MTAVIKAQTYAARIGKQQLAPAQHYTTAMHNTRWHTKHSHQRPAPSASATTSPFISYCRAATTCNSASKRLAECSVLCSGSSSATACALCQLLRARALCHKAPSGPFSEALCGALCAKCALLGDLVWAELARACFAGARAYSRLLALGNDGDRRNLETASPVARQWPLPVAWCPCREVRDAERAMLCPLSEGACARRGCCRRAFCACRRHLYSSPAKPFMLGCASTLLNSRQPTFSARDRYVMVSRPSMTT